MQAYYAKEHAWMEDGLVVRYTPSWTGATGTTMLDVTGNQRHASFVNVDRNTDWQSNDGNALSLNGTNSYAILGNSRDLYPNLAQITISFWARFRSFTNAYIQITETFDINGTNSNYQFSPLVKSNGKLAFYCLNTLANQSSYDGTGLFTLTTNTWYHLSFVFHGGVRQQGFVNGLLDGSATNPVASIGSNFNNIWFGASANFGTRNLNALVDDLIIFRRPLPTTELRSIYELGRGGGMLYAPPRRRSVLISSTFKAYWARRQQLVGSGVY